METKHKETQTKLGRQNKGRLRILGVRNAEETAKYWEE